MSEPVERLTARDKERRKDGFLSGESSGKLAGEDKAQGAS